VNHHNRVLIVDDEPPIRSALARYFARQGWIAEGVGTATAALDLVLPAGPNAYHVILVDLGMPGMDGAAFHDALRDSRPDMFERLIIASGDLDSPEALALKSRSHRPLVAKPFAFAMLLELMGRVARGER
jgi:DNA-binding NarL/FixJ family response regulator